MSDLSSVTHLVLLSHIFFTTFFQAHKINFQNLVKVDLKRILKFIGESVMHFNFESLTGLYAISIYYYPGRF